MSQVSEKTTKDDPYQLGPVASTCAGEVLDEESPYTVTHDAVFGEITKDGPNYRNVWSTEDDIS